MVKNIIKMLNIFPRQKLAGFILLVHLLLFTDRLKTNCRPSLIAILNIIAINLSNNTSMQNYRKIYNFFYNISKSIAFKILQAGAVWIKCNIYYS